MPNVTVFGDGISIFLNDRLTAEKATTGALFLVMGASVVRMPLPMSVIWIMAFSVFVVAAAELSVLAGCR